MGRQKTYFHVIEEGSYGSIASHGCFTTLREAQSVIKDLYRFYSDDLTFYVFESFTEEEPIICTI